MTPRLHQPSEPSAAPESVIVAPTRDLGDGFRVRRALPSARRRMVGPFVFFDQMGPTAFGAGQGLDVRPHPHIGLATVTYLFEGEILHRDSLGSVQRIQPGAVNWMTAGQGIVHSERSAPDVRAAGGPLFGIQLWVALPKNEEERAPEFTHTPEAALPVLEDTGVHLRVILGALHGARSPVQVYSDMFYAAATLQPGARVALPPSHDERAVYVAEGGAVVAGERFEPGALLLFRKGDPVVLEAEKDARTPARLLLLGGETMDGPRHLFWNFVASSPERLERAKADWRGGRFPSVPGETEFIPLPDDPPPVRYP
ncbi:pirin family protein [Aggregicoccus sp. 17bor-14]|uniref:pirin family protein n=1 Tax=Myxococcaceae TaxID=31 RepID=UPI00129D03AF|nr:MULTISPECIES: pirin family protein [Myxococcaceae]MBF5045326.1 pirin family protein [Simulacricoccus sp. 17bor-14]MRI91068.1 pirin family protein [Aggregicoccus sp. 17bor-14]